LISKTIRIRCIRKGYQKEEWLKNMLESDARDDIIIEVLDADYEDIESLNNLDVIKCI